MCLLAFGLLQHFTKTSLEQLINTVTGKSDSVKCHILHCIRTCKTVFRHVDNCKMSEYKNKWSVKENAQHDEVFIEREFYMCW